MAFIEYSEIRDTPLQKLLGHNVEVLKNGNRLLESFYKHSSFDPALQEEVRRAIAYQIGCAQCMSYECPAPVVTDIKTKVAVDFAKKMAQTQLSAKQDVDQMKKYFFDCEIAELSWNFMLHIPSV
jgi:hypothetical protein